jgi:hypothetical protein
LYSAYFAIFEPNFDAMWMPLRLGQNVHDLAPRQLAQALVLLEDNIYLYPRGNLFSVYGVHFYVPPNNPSPLIASSTSITYVSRICVPKDLSSAEVSLHFYEVSLAALLNSVPF